MHETRKNIKLYTAAVEHLTGLFYLSLFFFLDLIPVEHLTGMYAANPATADVWEPLRKILEDGAQMKNHLLGFVSQWCEQTGLYNSLSLLLVCSYSVVGNEVEDFAQLQG